MAIMSTTFSSPFPDQNPLLDVKIPASILGPDFDCYLPFSPSPPLEPTTPHDVENPETLKPVIGPDAQRLQPPSFSRKITSRPRDRNPLRDIELPNAIVAPEFQDVKPSSPSPTKHSARNFNSLACPPQLLPQEWSDFMTDFETTAARSEGQMSFAIAIGIATSVGYAVDDGAFMWGMWHDIAVVDDPKVTTSEPDWKREGLLAVVERWNERWADRGVRIALEVNGN